MSSSNRFFWLLLVFFLAWVFYLLRPILTPFLFGALLAYLGDPIADKLEKWKFSRNTAVIIVFAAFILLMLFIVLFLIPTINEQISKLSAQVPQYLEWIKKHTGNTVFKLFGIEELDTHNISEFLKKNLGDSSKLASFFVGSIKGSLNIIFTFFSYLFLVPVITFYLLRDWDKLVAKINDLIPKKYVSTVNLLVKQSDDVLGGFLRGQFSVMLALGVIYSIGLSILGLDMSIVIGMFSGMVSFVPYLGLIIGIFLAGVMAILQFQDWFHLLAVIMVFVVAQGLEGTVLTPKLVGDRVGLHPVAVLFAVMAGGQLFGFTGILLALPVAAVINVFLSYFKDKYLDSDIYQAVSAENKAKLADGKTSQVKNTRAKKQSS